MESKNCWISPFPVLTLSLFLLKISLLVNDFVLHTFSRRIYITFHVTGMSTNLTRWAHPFLVVDSVAESSDKCLRAQKQHSFLFKGSSHHPDRSNGPLHACHHTRAILRLSPIGNSEKNMRMQRNLTRFLCVYSPGGNYPKIMIARKNHASIR